LSPYCEERSDEAVSGPQETGLLRKRNDELAVTLLTGHCEGRRPEAIQWLRLLRKRKDDLAVTPLIGHSEAAKRRGISETASPNEQTRLAVTLSCRSKKARLLRRRKYDLAVTREKDETTSLQWQRKEQKDGLAVAERDSPRESKNSLSSREKSPCKIGGQRESGTIKP